MKHVRTPLHKWDSWEQGGLSWEKKVGTWGSELDKDIDDRASSAYFFKRVNKLYKTIR
jgi:hypothetical protein